MSKQNEVIKAYTIQQLEYEKKICEAVIANPKSIRTSILYGEPANIFFFECMPNFPLNYGHEIIELLKDAISQYDNMITEIQNEKH